MSANNSFKVMSTRSDFSSSRGMVHRAPEISDYKSVSSTNKYKLFDEDTKRRLTGSFNGESAVQLWQAKRFAQEEKEDILDKAGIDIVDVKMENKTCFRKGGIMDPRMGPIVPKVLCETCHQELGCCPGHMGRIELASPFIMHDGNSGILSKALIHALKCVCVHCSDLLDSPNAACEECMKGQKNRKIKSVSLLTNNPVSVVSGIKVDVKNKNRSVIVGARIRYENEALFEGCNVYAPRIRDVFIAIEQKYSTDRIKEVMGTLTQPSCLCPQVLLVLPPVHRPDKSRAIESSDKRIVGGCTTSYQNVLRQNAQTWYAYLKWKYMQAQDKTVRDEFYRRHNLSVPEPADNNADGFREILNKMRSIYVTTHEKVLTEKSTEEAKNNKKKTPENIFEEESAKLAEMINRLFNGMEATSRLDEHAELVDFSGLWNIIDGRQSGGGKMGLPRQSALGKRTGFIARGVILPNSHLSHTQIGMPYSFMRSLSLETGVGTYNLNEIIDEIRNPSEKDGRYTEIRIVVNTDAQYRGNFKWKFDSTDEDERNRLIGMLNRYKRGLFKQGSFVARRLLRDGDVAMVNRQPTLQRQNMQALRIVGVDGDCLIMNPEQAKAYNLDFDGDQMNVFVPQDEMARAELAVLHSPAALVATANGTAILGPGPSTVLGMFVLTDPKFKMDRRDSIKVFSEIFATLRETNFNILNDKSYYIDRGSWMQNPAEYETRYTTALNDIAQSDTPWQQAVRELISLCLPHGFDATVYGKKFDKYTGEGKRYKVASGTEPIPLVDAWRWMFANGAKYMVASVNVDGELVGAYIESMDVNTAVRRWRDLELLGDGEAIPRGAKTVAFGVPMDGNTEQTLPVLQIRSGMVNGDPPQLTGEMLKSLYNQVLHFAGGAGVIAAMESFQHIAHATMARLEMTASSPGDLFNAINNRNENSVDNELLNMATKEYVSTKGELVTQLDGRLHALCMQVKRDQAIPPEQHVAFLGLSEPAQTYVLNVLEPDKVVNAMQWITNEDDQATVITRAFSHMSKEDTITQLRGLNTAPYSSMFRQVIPKLVQMTRSRTLKAEIWRGLSNPQDVLAVLDRMNTAGKAKALVGVPAEQIESILSAVTDDNERAEIAEAVRDVHKKMLPACHDAILDSIIPLDIFQSYKIDENDHILTKARLVPANALDATKYHSIDNMNASLESLITGGTAACVQAGAQFPKGSAKDLRNMGVAIGHLKKTGMPSTETMNKSGKEAPTLRDWGFVADNYITGIRYFPNFLQSQQLGIRSELEGKQDVGKVGYSARQLLLAHMCVVAGMCGEARYLAGKGQERIVQFIYGSDGQDPHKLIPLAGGIDYDGSITLAVSWGTTSLPYPTKSRDTPMKEYLKKQCKYLLYGKSINSKLLKVACSIIRDRDLHEVVAADDIKQIGIGVASVLRFTSPEAHEEIGRNCTEMLHTRQDMQLGQLVAFAFDIVSRVEHPQNVRRSVELHSAMAIAKRWGTEGGPYPDRITDDSPLWSMCPLIRSEALVGLIGGKRFTELEHNTSAEETTAIFDSMKTYWGEQCALTPTIGKQLQGWMVVNLRFDTTTSIYSLYTANMLIGTIPCPLTKEGILDEDLLSKTLQEVSVKMVGINFRSVFLKQCLLKCCGDILSGNRKNDTLLEDICRDNSDTVHEVLSVNLNSSHNALINAIIASLQATLSKLPSRHTGLFQECRKMIEENSPMQLGQLLAFACIVVNRLEYSRIEYGAPIGGWAVEALMSDIQQAALDAKHRIGNQASAKDRFKELVEFPYPNDPVVMFENSARFDQDYFEDNKFSAEMVAYSLFYIHGRADRSIEERDWWGGNEARIAAMMRCNISEAGDAQFSRGVGVCIEFSTEEAAVEFCSKHLNLPSHKALKHDKRKVWQLSMGAKLRTIEDARGIESKRLVQVACTAAEPPLHRVVRELVKNQAASLEKQIEASVEWMRRWGAIGDDAIKFLSYILLQVAIQYTGLSLLNWWELLKRKVVSITAALHNDAAGILQNLTSEDVADVFISRASHDSSGRIRKLEDILGQVYCTHHYNNPDLVRYLVSVLIHVDAERPHHVTWEPKDRIVITDAVESRIRSVAKFKEEVWVQLFKDPIDMQDFVRLLVPKFKHLLYVVKELQTPPDNAAIEEAKHNLALVQKYQRNIAKDKHSCENEPLSTLRQNGHQVGLSRAPQTVEEELLNDTVSVQRDLSGTIVEYNQCTHGNLDLAPRELTRTKYEWYYATGDVENRVLLTDMIEKALANNSKPIDKTLLETCMNKLNSDVSLALKQTYGTGITDVVQAYQDEEDVLRNVWCLRFDMNDSAGKATSNLGQTDAERYKERLLEREKRTRESPLLSIAHKLFTNKTEFQGNTVRMSADDIQTVETLCDDSIDKHNSYEEIMELMRVEAPVDKVEAFRAEAKRVIDKRTEEMEKHYVLEGKGCPYPTSSSMSLTLDVDNPPIVQAACGIEIARLVMRQELDKLFAKSDADPRHAQILADTLSIDGFLRGIRRSDVAEVRTPLELSAYERIQHALNEAAIKEMECDEDTVHVAAMYNRPPQLGTGLIGSDLRHLPQCHNLMSVVTQMSAYTEPKKPPPNSTADDAMDVDSGAQDRGGEDSDNDMLEML